MLKADLKKGMQYIEEAANLGHSDALFWLGYSYHTGIGVPQDTGKGLSFLLKASEQKNHGALYYLAQLYRYGDGVAQDRTVRECAYSK